LQHRFEGWNPTPTPNPDRQGGRRYGQSTSR
jgi:hypothetical protein